MGHPADIVLQVQMRKRDQSVLTRLFLGLVGGTLGFMMGVGLTTLESVLDGAGGGRAGGNPPLPRAALDEAPSNAFCRTVERNYVQCKWSPIAYKCV